MPLFFKYNLEGTKAFFFKVYKYKVGDKFITREADDSKKRIEMITTFVTKINAKASKHKLGYELVFKESAQVSPEIMKITAFKKFKGVGKVPILSITKTDKKAKDMDIAKFVRKLCYKYDETILVADKVSATPKESPKFTLTLTPKKESSKALTLTPKKESPKATPKKESPKATPKESPKATKKPSPKATPKKPSPKATKPHLRNPRRKPHLRNPRRKPHLRKNRGHAMVNLQRNAQVHVNGKEAKTVGHVKNKSGLTRHLKKNFF